ncbi:MAG: hypothetical protein KC800_32605, partial [Candidatus Eremiobacteraeota bacterium]|nr:hypothetical protein [Candidatus Eremiobacteraeota bacterium]
SSDAVFLGTNLLCERREPVVAREWVVGEDAILRSGNSQPFSGELDQERLTKWATIHEQERGASDALIYRDSILETRESLRD